MPAAIAMTGGAGAAEPPADSPDPVFAAIERHRQTIEAYQAADRTANAGGDDKAAQAVADAARNTVGDAWWNWLTTPPTTMAGVLATLEYAASTSPHDPDRTVLLYWDLPSDCADWEPAKFPAMVAAALRRILEKSL